MLEFVKKTELAITPRGAGSTEPTIAINQAGQLRLNTAVSKHLNGSKLVAHSFNPETKEVTLGIFAKPHAKDWKEADYLSLRSEGEKGKSGAAAVLPFSGALHTIAKGGHTYDYKASGNQVLPAKVVKTKDGNGVLVTFTLPVGSLTPKPFTPRKRSPKVAQASAAPVQEQVGATA